MKLTDGIKKIHLTSNAFLALVSAVAVGLFILLLFCIKPASSPAVSDEILTLSASVRKHYQKQMDYRGLNTDFAIKEGIIPSQMVRVNKVFSKNAAEILVGADLEGATVAPFATTFSITYKNLDTKKCQSMLLSNFEASSGLSAITLSNSTIVEFTYGGEHPLPVSKEDAKEYCTTKNSIMFTFE